MSLDVLVLRSHGCASCGQVLNVLDDLKRTRFPDMSVQDVDIVERPELLAKFPILSSPGIVVNGKLVAHGFVTRKKLEQRIEDALEAGG